MINLSMSTMMDVIGQIRIRRIRYIVLSSATTVIKRIRSIYPMHLSRSVHRTIENKAIGMSHDIWKRNCKKKEDIIQRCLMSRKCFI